MPYSNPSYLFKKLSFFPLKECVEGRGGLAARRLPQYKFHANTSRAGSSVAPLGWTCMETVTGRVAGVLKAGPGGEVGVKEVVGTIDKWDTRSRSILRRVQRQDGGAVTVKGMKKHIVCGSLHALFPGERGHHQLQMFTWRSVWKTTTTASHCFESAKMSIWINRGTN